MQRYGVMRIYGRKAGDALAVKRSGGSQQRSRWQSAEIIS